MDHTLGGDRKLGRQLLDEKITIKNKFKNSTVQYPGPRVPKGSTVPLGGFSNAVNQLNELIKQLPLSF